MKELKTLRLGNLELRKATYLCEEPENPSYSIDYWYPNAYYGREGEYEKDGNFYIARMGNGFKYSIHKDCFKHKETCYSIASFNYDKHEGIYELHFVCDRPMGLKDDEIKTFWELIKYGYKYLNPDEAE